MGENAYDVTVVGAGPAGATMANLLAKAGLEVAMVDRASFPRPVACSGWLNARCAPMLKELGCSLESARAHPFRNVTFHRADFSQSSAPVFQEDPGFLIDRPALDHALVQVAAKRGVHIVQGQEVSDLQLKESSVRVKLAGTEWLTSRLLVLAAGRGTSLPERAGLHLTATGAPYWSAIVEGTAEHNAGEPRVAIVLGLDQRGSFAFCAACERRVTVAVHWIGDRNGVIPALINVCRRASEQGLVGADLSMKATAFKPIRSPAGAALDIETHVGKHTLVIGDAGGFVSAASNEGIYPAMWSASIAAKVIQTALQSTHSQDALISFDSAWRTQMADYLRSPHTDIQFLLPLIFTNQPMANRMGAAFFFGENI